MINKSDLDIIFDKVKDETVMQRSSKRSLVSFGKEINEIENNYAPFQNDLKNKLINQKSNENLDTLYGKFQKGSSLKSD